MMYCKYISISEKFSEDISNLWFYKIYAFMMQNLTEAYGPYIMSMAGLKILRHGLL